MRVLSYNVLANAYIRREWFPGTPASLLEPGARTASLIDRIAAFDADVICLQEVEGIVFEALADRFSDYNGEWLQKGHGKPDGCAIFSRGAVGRFARHLYGDGTGHVALVAVAKLGGRHVAIANTHARWSPPSTAPLEHLGARQLSELLEQRELLAPSVDGWVICGDLNAEPTSAALRRVLDAGFSDCRAGPISWTPDEDRYPRKRGPRWQSENDIRKSSSGRRCGCSSRVVTSRPLR